VSGLPTGDEGDWVIGAFTPAGALWVENEDQDDVAYAINVSTVSVVKTLVLSPAMPAFDFTYADGYLWGLDDLVLYQINLSTGGVTRHDLPSLSPAPSGDEFNAAWTYANGDLGFVDEEAAYSVRISGVSTGTFAATVYPDPVFGGGADGTSCQPPITTTVDDASTNRAWTTGGETTGASAYDTATLPQASPPPTGTVTYNFFTNGTCTNPVATTSTVTLSNGAAPDSATSASFRQWRCSAPSLTTRPAAAPGATTRRPGRLLTTPPP